MAYYRSRPTRVGFLFLQIGQNLCDTKYRAFWGKRAEARSEMRDRWHGRPCLLQKMVKGTVACADQWAPASRIGAFGAGRSRPDGRRLANKERSWRGAIDKCLRHPNQPSSSPQPAAVVQTNSRRRSNRSLPAAFNKIRKAPRWGASYGKETAPHRSASFYISPSPPRMGQHLFISVPSHPRMGRLLTFRLKTPLFIAAVAPASHPLAYWASR